MANPAPLIFGLVAQYYSLLIKKGKNKMFALKTVYAVKNKGLLSKTTCKATKALIQKLNLTFLKTKNVKSNLNLPP